MVSEFEFEAVRTTRRKYIQVKSKKPLELEDKTEDDYNDNKIYDDK